MKNKEVYYGEEAVLECLSVGSPKPKITWTKNNKSLVFSKRHHLSSDDQLLVITDVVLEDTGLYECELSNDLGAERGRSELKVLPAGRHFTAEISSNVVFGIVITTIVTSVVITSAVWVIFIHLTRRRNRRCIRTSMSPTDIKSENSSHSSKDSGTGDSTKRSYQDLLLTTSK